MTDTPKSDGSPTRFNTPVADLTDHRFQPPSLPRSDASSNPPPRQRFQPESLTWANDPHPNRPRLGPRRRTVSDYPNPTPIMEVDSETMEESFEEAVVDEEDTNSRPNRRPAVTLRVPSHGPAATMGEDPPTATTGRNSGSRRRRMSNDRVARSVISNSSSRSGSPTGSVNAFASTRIPSRPRAGTAASGAPSFITLPRSPLIQPTAFSRRPSLRPSILEDGFSLNVGDDSSGAENVQDDVCFPQDDEEESQHFIDFDVLHEFVNEYKHKPTNVPLPFGNKHGIMGHAQRTRFFHSLLNDKKLQGQPWIHSVHKNSHLTSEQLRRPSTQMTMDGDSSTDEEKKLDALEAEQGGDVIALDPIIRWSFFSSEEEDTVHAAELGDLLMDGETFQTLFAQSDEGGVWWLDILMPSEEEVEAICKAFGVHGLTREDIIQQETHEKVELFNSYYFVCFRSFFQMEKTADCYLEPVNVYAVVFREGIITFTFCPSPHAANVRKRMSRLRDYVSLGSDWICYALIDDIVDSYQPVIRDVEVAVDAIEDGVFTIRAEDTRAMLLKIGESRKTVMSISRLLGGKADVIKGFAKRCTEQYLVTPRQDVGLYLSDIQDHVVTMMSNLSHFEKMLSRSHSNYLAQISLNHVEQGNRANEVLSKVTFIATILVPLNLICGLFGMNVNVPGKNDGGYAWFCGIIGLMLFLVTSATIIAKRLRYI